MLYEDDSTVVHDFCQAVHPKLERSMKGKFEALELRQDVWSLESANECSQEVAIETRGGLFSCNSELKIRHFGWLLREKTEKLWPFEQRLGIGFDHNVRRLEQTADCLSDRRQVVFIDPPVQNQAEAGGGP